MVKPEDWGREGAVAAVLKHWVRSTCGAYSDLHPPARRRAGEALESPGSAIDPKLESIHKGGSTERKSISIIILDRPEDEATAIAVDDDGGPQGKGKGGKKSN